MQTAAGVRGQVCRTRRPATVRVLSVDITGYVLQETDGSRKNATYRCRVHVTGGRPSWTILRRYRQWDELCGQLSGHRNRAALPVMPGKKVLGNMNPSFLESRRRDLQRWVTEIVGMDSFRDSDAFWQWLQPRSDDAKFAAGESQPAGGRPALLDDLPPVMQGTLMLAGPVGKDSRWFELRGAELVWFEKRDGEQLGRVDLMLAIVSTSSALQHEMASHFGGRTGNFFSITSQQSGPINIGAEDDSQMRAWMSAILAQQGDKAGAASVLTRRASLSSHELAPSSNDDNPNLLAAASQGLDDNPMPFCGDDPLGGLVDITMPAPLSTVAEAADGPTESIVSPRSVEIMFEGAGIAMTKVSVICAYEVALERKGLTSQTICAPEAEPEPEPEPEHAVVHALCVCECHCEFAVIHIQVPVGDSTGELVIVACMPVVGTTSNETHESDHSLSFSNSLVERTPPLNGFIFCFRDRSARDEFRALVHNAGRAVGPKRSNTHQWLAQFHRHGEPQREESTQGTGSTSLLSQSSTFFGDVDADYLLDPERRRRLRSTATADSKTGAQEVKLVPSSDSITGTAALQTRIEICDGKPVTMYELSLERRNFRWTVSRRYNEFSVLQDVLKEAHPHVMQRAAAAFPPKGIHSSTNPKVIRERSTGLYKWLSFLISDPNSTRCTELVSFLGMNIAGSGDRQPAQEPLYRKLDQRSLKSVDHLGRTVAELINEHSANSSPEQVLEHLTEFRAFRNSLLILSFALKRTAAHCSTLKLVPDAIEVSRPADSERIPYADITSVECNPPAIVIACAGVGGGTFDLEGSSEEVHRLAEELDDRMQLTKLILDKEQQLLSLGSGELQRQTSAATQRRLEQMTGKTEIERIAASVERILDGSRPQDKSEITRPLNHFLQTTFVELQQEPSTAVGHVREVMNDLQQRIIEDRAHELEIVELGSDVQAEKLSRVVNAQLERATVAPIREQLLLCLTQSISPERLQIVQAKRLRLRSKPQTFFGIPASATSPTNWRSAVEEMDKISHHQLPTDKTNALLQCATRIYDLYGEEASDSSSVDSTSAKEEFLAADDFLSVFTYVTVQSNWPDLPIELRFMSDLCDPELLSGRQGYYLTVLESAIQCICDADADNETIFPSGGKSPAMAAISGPR